MTEFNIHLQNLHDLTKEDMEGVSREIDEVLEGGLGLTSLIGRHILQSGGKRLRPLLSLSVARMCGYRGVEHIGPAACMELLHSASLLHDDVIDESEQRRGLTTVHRLWGNKRSILVGDFLFAKTLTIMDRCKVNGVVERLAWASSMLAQGELLQLYWLERLDISESSYLEILLYKTAALFSVSASIGGIIAEKTSEEIKILHQFGEEIGLAFQIVDDVLDYLGQTSEMKKDVGRDFAEKKLTYPLILAIEKSQNEQEKIFWDQLLHSNEEPSKEEREKALMIMNNYSIFETVQEKIYQRIDNAKTLLSHFEDNPYRKGLYEFLDYCKTRIA